MAKEFEKKRAEAELKQQKLTAERARKAQDEKNAQSLKFVLVGILSILLLSAVCVAVACFLCNRRRKKFAQKKIVERPSSAFIRASEAGYNA